MVVNTSEPTMKLINKELLIFKRYQVNVESVHLNGGKNERLCFL